MYIGDAISHWQFSSKALYPKNGIPTENDMMTVLRGGGQLPLKDNNVSQKLKENKIDIPNGILFAANSGGELTIIKALSNEAEIPAIIMENPQDLEQIITAVEARYKKTGLKTIILAQGFDKYFSNCATCDNTIENAFRNKIRGIKEKGGLFIATTSDKKLIREDFMQSGIIDKVFEVSKPSESDRTEFLKRYFKDKEIFQDVNNDEVIQKMVVLTDNRSYSDMLRVLDETARTALAKGKNADLQTFEEQLKDFSQELGIVPITEENRTASYDTPEFKRVPIEKDEIMSLDELGGMSEVIQQLREYVIDVWNPEIRQELIENKIEPSGGFILEGSPGGGKTTAIETLAREMNVPLFKMELDQEDNKWVGGIDKNIKEIFKQMSLIAKVRKAPVMLFFDEAERFFSRTSEAQLGSHEVSQTNKFKSEMNNAASMGIILAGATNHIELVNQEVIGNPRRMGTVIHCGEPNLEDRKDILKRLLSGLPIITEDFTEENIEDIAVSTSGFSIGQLSDAVDKIIVQAVKRKENLTPQKVIQEFRLNIVPMHIK